MKFLPGGEFLPGWEPLVYGVSVWLHLNDAHLLSFSRQTKRRVFNSIASSKFFAAGCSCFRSKFVEKERTYVFDVCSADGEEVFHLRNYRYF